MKELYYRSFPLCFCTIALLFLFSCKKDTAIKTSSSVSIYQIAVEDPTNFSFLKTAIKKAGLVKKLSGEGAYTIFAPTNTAFKNAGFADTIAVQNADSALLNQMLSYHLLDQKQAMSALPLGASKLTTLTGKSLSVSKSSNLIITVNGAIITSKDHEATNGILHVVNRVLGPPMVDIATIVSTNSNLTYVAAAITRASQGSTNFSQLLSGTSPYTFFAPTNSAFVSAGYTTVAAVTAADPNMLAALLNYHLVPGQTLSPDFGDSSSVASLKTNALYFNQPSVGNTTVNGVLFNGSNANNLATNGVVHILSKVLVPPTLTLNQTITGNTSLTFLAAAIIRASQGSTNYTQLLSGAAAYTIFAPTDAAFKTAGFATITAVSTADPAALASLLNNQLATNRKFSTIFAEGSTAQSLANSTLTFSIVSGFKVKGAGNTALSNLAPIDVLAINGVLHVSDQVLK
ncbi:MAG: fasciclin domain-containing protein [Bacteroidota bacterium]